MQFIKILKKNKFLLATTLLGLSEAELWIGAAEGPLDNDDARVLKERALATNQPGGRPFGISAISLKESTTHAGWFAIDTSNWEAGTYRFNIHSKANVKAPNGSELRNVRDGEFSWPTFTDQQLVALPKEQQLFLYLEPNGAGFCMRIDIAKDGTITAAGNGPEWIEQWPKIKKEVEKHYEEQIEISLKK